MMDDDGEYIFTHKFHKSAIGPSMTFHGKSHLPSTAPPSAVTRGQATAPAFIWISKGRSTLKHFKHQHAAGPPQLTSKKP